MGVTSDPAARAGKAKARTTSNIAVCISTSLSLRPGLINPVGSSIKSHASHRMSHDVTTQARTSQPRGSQPHTRLSVSRDTVPHVP